MKAAETLAVVLTIITSLGLGSIVLGHINNLIPLFIIGIIITIIAVMIIIYLLFYTLIEERLKTQSKPIDTRAYPPPPPEEVEIMRKEIVYVYFPDGKTMLQRKRLRMRSLQNNVVYFKDRYRWSGRGKCNIKSLSSAIKIGNQHREETWEYFDVIFPHPLHKDEVVDYTIEWDLVDEDNMAVDYLSTMIDRVTKYLLLQVSLPPELAPKRAYCYEYANYIETLPIATQEVEWNPATHNINYEVRNPIKYHKYSIRWYKD